MGLGGASCTTPTFDSSPQGEESARRGGRSRNSQKNQLRVAKQVNPFFFSAAQASWAAPCSVKPEKRAR